MPEMKQNNLMNISYCSAIPRAPIEQGCKAKMPLKDIKKLGGGFTVMAAAIIDAAMNTSNTEGLYRCVFPKGVTGHLATFNNEPQAFLGTIMNEAGIAGQARWIPVDHPSVLMAIDPVALVMAVALVNINSKLNVIQETQKEILEFMNQEKESDLEGAVNSLTNIHEMYSFHNDNTVWKGSQLTIVSSIKVKAEQNIIFYRKQINGVLKKQKAIHSNHGTDKIKNDLQRAFKYYRISVYLYSYASFLEVMLGDNYKKEYLSHISDVLKEYSYQYKIDYTECYNQLDCYSGGSIQNKILDGVGAMGKTVGGVIAKTPVISKGLIDEALIATGEKMDELSTQKSAGVMDEFKDNRDAGIQFFIDNIEAIDNMCNSPLEVLFDEDMLYLCA